MSLTIGVDDALVEQSDVIVFLRPAHPMALEMLNRARGSGRLVVVDLDDDLWNLPLTNPYVGYWSEASVQHVLSECVARADLVTVTTPELARVVERLNPNTRILPNMLPDAFWPDNAAQDTAKDRLVIGWAGGGSHFADLKLLSGVVESILSKFAHVEFAFAGIDTLPFGSHERVRSLPGVPIEHYPSLLADFDIALAPVVDDRFNRSKSDLKYLEYAMLGLPVVASSAATYTRVVRPGENGLLAGNAKDWIRHLTRLVQEPELRAALGSAARATAETRLISRNVDLWKRAYRL